MRPRNDRGVMCCICFFWEEELDLYGWSWGYGSIVQAHLKRLCVRPADTFRRFVLISAFGSVPGCGGLCRRAGDVAGVAVEDVGLWWSCEMQPRTEGNPDDRDHHALDRAFAKA